MPFTNGYSTGSPMRRREREELVGTERTGRGRTRRGARATRGGSRRPSRRPGRSARSTPLISAPSAPAIGRTLMVRYRRRSSSPIRCRQPASARNCRRRSTLRTFPDGGAREVVDDHASSSGHFCRARPIRSSSAVRSRELDRVDAGREPHDRARVLAEPLVGRGDHRDLGDLRRARRPPPRSRPPRCSRRRG